MLLLSEICGLCTQLLAASVPDLLMADNPLRMPPKQQHAPLVWFADTQDAAEQAAAVSCLPYFVLKQTGRYVNIFPQPAAFAQAFAKIEKASFLPPLSAPACEENGFWEYHALLRALRLCCAAPVPSLSQSFCDSIWWALRRSYLLPEPSARAFCASELRSYFPGACAHDEQALLALRLWTRRLSEFFAC